MIGERLFCVALRLQAASFRHSNTVTIIESLAVRGGRAPFVFSMPPTAAGVESWPLTVNAKSGRITFAPPPPSPTAAKRLVSRSTPSLIVAPVIVTDADGQQAFTRVELHTNARDTGGSEAPRFIGASADGYFEAHISLHAAEGERIAQFAASGGGGGGGGGEGNELEFALGAADDELTRHLALDARSGILTLRAPLSAEFVGRQLEGAIVVSDRRNPPQQQRRALRLHVVDGSVPEFSRLHYLFAVAEDAAQGRIVGQLTLKGGATDATFEASSSSGAAEAPFTIDRATGNVLVRRTLDRETVDLHSLVVVARDAAGHRALALVTITINDVVNMSARTFRLNPPIVPSE